MKICVTGGLGFIGSELIKTLKHEMSVFDILCIDDRNELDLDRCGDIWFQDYNSIIENNYYNTLSEVDFIFHLGANSSTRATMDELVNPNFLFPIRLMKYAKSKNIPVVFASSASVYGAVRKLNEVSPQTPYAYLKSAVEKWIEYYSLSDMGLGDIISLRFHNVYGATESHKGNMASIVSKWIDNHFAGIETNDLFNDSDNIFRDFVHVKDVVGSCMTMLKHWMLFGKLPHHYTMDIGTGKAVSFERVAKEIIKHTKGTIQYVINPYTDKDYQFHTQADISDYSKLFESLYKAPFVPIGIEEGVKMVYEEKKADYNYTRFDNDNPVLERL